MHSRSRKLGTAALQAYGLLALVVGLVTSTASGTSFAQKVQGYVQQVGGNVSGQTGTQRPRGLSEGQALPHNATITTGPQSYAVLRFNDGMVVLLKDNSTFQVQSYAYDSKAPEVANAVFHLLRGGLRMATGEMTFRNRDALKVGTPLATIGIRSTEFIAELTNTLFLQVIRGVVTTTNAAGVVQFRAGQVGVVKGPSMLGELIPIKQIPPGIFRMPDVSLTPAPGKISPGVSSNK